MPFPGTVIVTGASGNLGSAVCSLLTERGCKVVGVYHHIPQAKGRLALEVEAGDLADPTGAARLVATARNTLGRIDGLVHTVGGFAMGSVAGDALDLFERMWRINLATTASMVRAVWPAMQGIGGSIVAIGAQPALHAGGGFAAYASSKAAVMRLIEAAAEEGKTSRIRANTVVPSIIDTPQNRAAMPNAAYSDWVTPAKIAAVIAFLLSDDAAAVSGAHVPVTNGG